MEVVGQINLDLRVITGGHLKQGQFLVVQTKEVSGRTFFVADKCKHYFKKYLNNDTRMLDLLVRLRNKAVDGFMLEK